MMTVCKRRSFALDKEPYHLWRLSEDEYRDLRQSSLPIKIKGFLLWKLWLSEQNDPERLSLPQALLSLEALFGKSSDFLDIWKCSFWYGTLSTTPAAFSKADRKPKYNLWL
jgi:hypothetical protein